MKFIILYHSYNSHNKGPRTLQLKLQKVVIVHTHYNFFSQLQRFFILFYIWTTFFTKIFQKNLCENLCSVQGP